MPALLVFVKNQAQAWSCRRWRYIQKPLATRARIGAAIVAVVVASVAAPITAAAMQPTCGSRELDRAPVQYKHAIWVWLENQSYDATLGPMLGDTPAPYIRSVAAGCALATNYHNVTHPSLPNYIAATSGDTHGLAQNCAPTSCRFGAPSLFGQLDEAGLSWTSYIEDMPTPCSRTDSPLYTPLVNPAVYYDDAAADCAARDVPMGAPTVGPLATAIVTGTLPTFSFLIPNLCNDGHNCPVDASDVWLARWLPVLVSSPDYTAGNTIIFIAWDEGEAADFVEGENCAAAPTAASCHVAAIVISPYVVAGTTSSIPMSHYSLLKSTEQLLGIPMLGHAADADVESLALPFHAQLGAGHDGPWQLVKSFATLAAARANAHAARAALAEADLSISIRRSGHSYNVRVAGFYTAVEAATIRSRLSGQLAQAALRLRPQP
jgi:phosphatidylinositol-3-phosphatase